MRSTIIPAQITTVEDKIAGSLSMTQMLLLMTPVFLSALVYAVFIPQMKLPAYKIPIILVISIICFILALRIKGKIILGWILILLNYTARPKYYLFNKNDTLNRTVDFPDEKDLSLAFSKRETKRSPKVAVSEISLVDQSKLENLIVSGKLAVSYQFKKKQI